mmetsp:Transcript_39153/g.103561  ORF Transcript_39153/g.103561 Transcript_39153/m.103561 type:complete len:166 (-) Transcript_39153:59-556(-)
MRIRRQNFKRFALSTEWVFCRRRWLNPCDPLDLRMLQENYVLLYRAFPFLPSIHDFLSLLRDTVSAWHYILVCGENCAAPLASASGRASSASDAAMSDGAASTDSEGEGADPKLQLGHLLQPEGPRRSAMDLDNLLNPEPACAAAARLPPPQPPQQPAWLRSILA